MIMSVNYISSRLLGSGMVSSHIPMSIYQLFDSHVNEASITSSNNPAS